MALKPYVVSLEQAQAWWEKARLQYEAAPFTVARTAMPWGEKWAPDIPEATGCQGRMWGHSQCPWKAGWGTSHPGIGACRLHRGNTIRGMTEGFMIMAHAFADPEKIRRTNVPAPQALIEDVNRTVNAVRWLDEKLSTATSDDQLIEGGDLEPFVKMWQGERTHLVRASMAAITAKAHEIMEQRHETHGNLLRSMLHEALEHVIGDVVAGRVALDAGLKLYAAEILDGTIVDRVGAAENVSELTDTPVDSQ